MLGTFVLSSGYYDKYYGRAVRARSMIEKKINQLFKIYDVILGPVSPFPAFKIGEKINNPLSMYLADKCSVLANLTQCPAISIPGKLSEKGLPIGIQIMCRRFNDSKLLEIASKIQERWDYHEKKFNY